ncbi:MAG: T9SS type A sorting domain-containing protein [Bacteroidetes bacterium]|nr:T9SS type A sorting domain-containing protein [Bacteroidota bacterium]
MKKYIFLSSLFLLLISHTGLTQNARMLPEVTPAGKGKVNTMVDNIGYWSRMVQLGYVRPNPQTEVPSARFTGTGISAYIPSPVTLHSSFVTRHSSFLQNSPDVPVTGETDVTQSENSLFIDPNDENVVLNSNNSSSWISGYAENPYGADALYSLDNGQDWGGSTDGVNGNNAGDPSTAIGLNGWWYVGRITGDYGQAVSYSKDQGKTWKRVKVGYGPTAGIGLLDKNHLWVDNSPDSPYKGYIYDAWTNFIPGNPDTNQVEIVRSADHGLTWSSPHNISAAALALKLNHGVNLQTGPNGEVYAAWSIYDSWPSDETAIGFTKSVDGGGIFMPATRIISNIKGIRASMTGKNMRVSSFPCMAVDNSNGPNRGTIYLVWSNVGYPGVNTGSDIDLYLIRSSDGGSTWSAPVRVNQDPAGLGKQHYLPWMACDRVTGGVCVVYYDDRNVDSTSAAVFVSSSYDGGNSWTDMQVSDYTFTPEPIPGLAFSYFGDYIGIQSDNMKVYPVWTDNHHSGRAMAYTSPFDLGPNPNQPWVSYYSDSLATVSGTGNVTMNNGDSLHLSLGLRNIGDQPDAGVSAVISTNSPYILITDSSAGYGPVAAGQVKVVPNGYAFRVSDTIPDNLKVRFDVSVTGTDSTWYSHFAIESHAPALKISGISIVDTLAGNRNGRMDPGETVQLVVRTGNSGDFGCQSAYGLLSSSSPFLTLVTDSAFLNNIQPGEVKNAVFTVVVNPETPVGSGADLVYVAHSGPYSVQRPFREMIGMVVEDWETNTFNKFPWQQGGAKPWTLSSLIRYEGSYASESGVISDYQNSQMLLTYNSVADDSISFYLRTSSEQDYDYLMFTIDGVLQDQWSGDTPWTRAAFPVAAGQHVFKWIYLKDLAYSYGMDRAWVDFIALPPPVLPVVDPGANDTVCAGLNVILHATAQQYDSVKWTSAGDGVFGNDTMLITSYTPGTSDLVSGNTTLRLTGYCPYGSTGNNKLIHINPRPVAAITVSPRDTVCAGQSIQLSADTTGVTTWQWMPGSFTTPGATYDTTNAGGPGKHLVRLVTANRFQCQNRDSVYLTFKNCTGIEENPTGSFNIYPNPNNGVFSLVIDIENPGPVQLSVSNALNVVVFRVENVSAGKQGNENINLNFLPDGVYLLSLKTARGTTSRKLIIRK